MDVGDDLLCSCEEVESMFGEKPKSSHRLAEIKNNVTSERSGLLNFLAGATITLQYHQTGFSANTFEHRK